MDKPIRSRFRVENKNSNTFVDVEIIARESDSDFLMPLEEDEAEELELEDIDLVQLRESSAKFTQGALPATVQQGAPADWGRASVPPEHSAMVLYPKPSARQVVDELETVISTLPTVAQTHTSHSRRHRRIVSYAAVAGVSILGTWFFMKGPAQKETPSVEAAELLTRDVATPPSTSPSSSIPVHSASMGIVGGGSGTPVASTETLEPTDRTQIEASEVDAPSLAPDPTETPTASVSENTEVSASAEVEKKTAPSEPSEISGAAARTASVSPETTESPKKQRNSVIPEQIKKVSPSSSPVVVSAATLLKTVEDLPEMPSKALVRSTMDSLVSEVKKCKGGLEGRVVVEVVVSGTTGRVIASKAIDQVSVGATAGRCAARAVEAATFPPFKKSTLTIKYPYDL